jgi:hypothetical protein
VSEYEQTPDRTTPAVNGGEAVRPEAGAAEEFEVSLAGSADSDTPVAAALRELDTLGERDLADHPDVYQRIHAELQSALATIDNA